MSDKKISQLTASTTPLTGAEVLPVVQSGVTKQVSVANLTAGRAVTFASASSTGTLFSSGGSPNSNNGINMWFDTATNTGKIRSYEGGVDWRPQDYNAKTHTFQTNDNDVVQITNDGNIKILVAGKGIDFSADPSAAGMTSELLDDYEEGLYTATLTPSSSGSLTMYGGTSTLQYTKVGRMVTVTGGLQIETASSPVGYIRLNLPFAVSDLAGISSRFAGQVIVNVTVSGANCNEFVVYAEDGAAEAGIYLGDGTTLQSDSAEQMGVNSQITVSFTYIAA